MQNGDDAPVSTENSIPAPTEVPDEVTKQSYRVKVWRHLESNGLAMFPRPVYSRIPNYKGAADAAARLAELDVFKNANTVKVNADKPQEPVRMVCLEHKKTVYVPVARLQAGWLARLQPPEDGPAAYRKAVSRNGMDTYGQPVGLEEAVSLDLVVVGSVAVSRDGYRIGKGRGFGDLEFGVLMHMKCVQPSTIVLTTVHDSQVFDSLPSELFGPHDVPVDIIVTPTQVISCQRSSQRPAGVLWGLLSQRRLNMMSALQQLRDAEIMAGRACELKDEDTDVEERPAARPRRTRRRTRSHKSHSEGEGNVTEGEEGKSGRRRPARRRHSRKSACKDAKDAKDAADAKDAGDAKADAKPRRNKRAKPEIDFSVKLSKISPNTRVRDVKAALSERGVKPHLMVWKGFRGFCYLHFFKPNPQKGEGEGAAGADVSLDSVLAALDAMSVTGSGAPPDTPPAPTTLRVEPHRPQPAAVH